jgi:hypothetical protein
VPTARAAAESETAGRRGTDTSASAASAASAAAIQASFCTTDVREPCAIVRTRADGVPEARRSSSEKNPSTLGILSTLPASAMSAVPPSTSHSPPTSTRR